MTPAALGRDRISALIPHAGAMCLLEEVLSWTAEGIVCRTLSHLDPANPLRRAGRLHALCGAEYALQAAALHGALLADGTPQPAGYLAALRGVELGADRLDDPAYGALHVEAVLQAREASGLIYALRVRARDGRGLFAARGTVVLPGHGGLSPGQGSPGQGSPGQDARGQDARGRSDTAPERGGAFPPGPTDAPPERGGDAPGPGAAPRTPPA